MIGALADVYLRLGISKENGLYFFKDPEWESLFPPRAVRVLKDVVKPNAFFSIDNKPFILFFDNPSDTQSLLKSIWNFNESPIVIILDRGRVSVFNGFKFIKEKGTLQKFGGEDRLDDFSYFNLVTGQTWDVYEKDLKFDHRVDYQLLKNIYATRERIISHLEHDRKIEISNSLIGKVIFIRYLIDRHVRFRFDDELRSWTNDEFCEVLQNREILKNFFRYLDDQFGGSFFQLADSEIDLFPSEVFNTLTLLINGNDIESGQSSLFNPYDFSIIPIEFISNVYEMFIGHDSQQEQGSFYTPIFLVDYILSQTVDKAIDREKNQSILSCKVLDPSCGSGIFLVETLRKLIEANGLTDSADLREVVLENIYGVDKDPNAINVAIFSLYITLLDYQKPSDIENFRFPILLGRNLFVDDIFNEDGDFNRLRESVRFDFILGNPPWKGSGLGPLGEKYIKSRRMREGIRENLIHVDNGEIAQGFLLRMSDLSDSDDTKIALIVRSTVLYNPGYKEQFKFRKYFFENYEISEIFELGAVRKEVFDKSSGKAIAPAAVLFYKYNSGNQSHDNVINHLTLKPSRLFTLFKVFSLQRGDFKQILQRKVLEFPYLLKVLVYGSYLDFNFIQRLNRDYPSISKATCDPGRFVVGTGIQFSSNEKDNSEFLIGRKFIDTKSVNPFHLSEVHEQTFGKSRVHRTRDPRIYDAPFLLVREGLEMKNLKGKSVVVREDAVFKDSLAVIKAFEEKDVTVLQNISGIVNSILYSYVSVMTFSSIGIERERAKNYNKFSVPFIRSEKLVKLVDKLENLYASWHESLFERTQIQQEIEDALKGLDVLILDELQLSNQELSLIQYTRDFIIPIIVSKSRRSELSKQKASSSDVEAYIQPYLKKFDEVYELDEKELTVEVQISNQLIGVFFKISDKNRIDSKIKWSELTDYQNFLKFLHRLGVEKITDQLFVRKDVRGFEKEGFYVVKPNERMLWQAAIGYLDMYEFVDAILIEARKN